MVPLFRLPHGTTLSEPEYVDSLLTFITSSDIFQDICGGIHILDFLTREPDLYSAVVPQAWREWFHFHEVSVILDLFLREDVSVIEGLISLLDDPLEVKCNSLPTWRGSSCPPLSLLQYVRSIRTHALLREFTSDKQRGNHGRSTNACALPRHVAVGMKPKKIHEVESFVQYVDDLMADIDKSSTQSITHVVDFGSGQNYLGRALASPPRNKRVVALESKAHNIEGAKNMDITAKLSEKRKIMRNKKKFRMGHQSSDSLHSFPDASKTEGSQYSICIEGRSSIITSNSESDNGNIQYIETRIEDGNLSKVVGELKYIPTSTSQALASDLRLIVISLHSCGNLVHHGIQSIILNPAVKAVALIGCCYNLVTERLGPPTYKLPYLRSPNFRLDQTSSAYDPNGFPMSDRLTTYKHQYGEGIRMNITARMMACQAPYNWTAADCESFFTRNFYRALLQRIFLDRGVVEKPTGVGESGGGSPRGWKGGGPALIIGSLRKGCYTSFIAYVRGAIVKLADDPDCGAKITERMNDLTDEDINQYEKKYQDKKKELSIIWSLMAFSASVVESTIVVDRWLWLKEQEEIKDCWVETVFDYGQSPRNLVIVGIKK